MNNEIKFNYTELIEGDSVLVTNKKKYHDGITEMLICKLSPEKRHILVQWSPSNNGTTQWLSVEYVDETYTVLEVIRGKNWKRLDELQKEALKCQE